MLHWYHTLCKFDIDIRMFHLNGQIEFTTLTLIEHFTENSLQFNEWIFIEHLRKWYFETGNLKLTEIIQENEFENLFQMTIFNHINIFFIFLPDSLLDWCWYQYELYCVPLNIISGIVKGKFKSLASVFLGDWLDKLEILNFMKSALEKLNNESLLMILLKLYHNVNRYYKWFYGSKFT